MTMQPTIKLLDQPTKYVFFTGKGGVGKTSVSTAVSIALADAGKNVLLVSTDAASNLDEMLGIELSNQPVAVPDVPGMFVLNIDPATAATDYRARVVEQMGSQASDQDIALVRRATLGGPARPKSPPSMSSPTSWRKAAQPMTMSCSIPLHGTHAQAVEPAQSVERISGRQ